MREETAAMVAADLPAEPRSFRFQCRDAVRAGSPPRYQPPLCASADAGEVTSPDELAARAAAEAAQPVSSADDRLRRAAWLRVAALHDTSDAPATQPRLFTVTETISAADIPKRPPATASVMLDAVTFSVPMQVQVAQRTMRHGSAGSYPLTCRVAAAAFDCRLLYRLQPAQFRAPNGDLDSGLRGWFMGLYDVHAGLRPARVTDSAKDGRPTAGMDVKFLLDLRVVE